MPREERLDLLPKGKATNAQVVGHDALLLQKLQRFSHCAVTASDRDDTQARPSAFEEHRRRQVGRSGAMFLRQSVHYLLVLGGCLGISPELVVSRASGEEGALGVDAGERSSRDLLLVDRPV